MRDSGLDNFKFILIALVVVGHTLETVMGRFEWSTSLYIFIYLFHMPMFAYVSGIFSSRELNKSTIENIVGKLIIPYLIVEALYSVFDFVIFDRVILSFTPLIPYWLMWYLLSLIFWKLMLPIVAMFKFPIALSIVAGLICGLFDYDYLLSYSRTFVFFPFFVLGHYRHWQTMEIIQRYKIYKIFAFILIFTALYIVFTFVENDRIVFRWLYGSRSFASLGEQWEQGVQYRFGLYTVAILIGLSIMALVSKTRQFYTWIGQQTLYIFILHGFIIKLFVAYSLNTKIVSDWHVTALIIGSLFLLPILGSRPSVAITNFLMNPFGISSLVGKLSSSLIHQTSIITTSILGRKP